MTKTEQLPIIIAQISIELSEPRMTTVRCPWPQFYTSHSHSRPPLSQDQQQDTVLNTRHISKPAALHRQALVVLLDFLFWMLLLERALKVLKRGAPRWTDPLAPVPRR